MRLLSCCRALLFTVVAPAFTVSSYAQKTEIKLNAYSGLFSYRGNGTSSTTTANSNDTFTYWNWQPFGRKSAFSYVFEMQVQRATRKHHLYGLGVSWEELKSLTRIDSVRGDIPRTIPIKGKINIANSSLTFNPYIGQRFVTGKWNFDVLAGIDLSICTKLQEAVYYFSPTESKYTRYYKGYRRKQFGDIRPRIQFNAAYNQFGIAAGYSIGLQDMYRTEGDYYYRGIKLKAYSNFLRLGINYKLK